MALKNPQSAVSLSRHALKHCRSRNACSAAAAVARPAASTATSPISTSPTATSPRTFATSAARPSEAAAEAPRWSYTPERMKAPFSISRDPSRPLWQVNEDPKKLDSALNMFLGRDGEKMLSDELKWLAVTHKSFDQGRRGFNDRLAFLGRQICIREAMESIIMSPPKHDKIPADEYADMREPFDDPALRGVDNLSESQPSDIFSMKNLSKLALDTGLSEVVRWQPRMHDNVKGSGLNPVLSGVVFALVGAVALQNGGKAASRIVRQRIMRRIRDQYTN